MSKSKSKSKKSAPVVESAAPPVVLLREGAIQDKLKGRVGARTHAIHQVLLSAERPLSTKEIASRASALMGRACNACASHLNTMKGRNFLTRVDGAWALTSAAREVLSAE